jgi:lipase maturation factor 1
MAQRPTLIYDGDCKFCARWVERWRVTTGNRVRYITSEAAAEQFPEIAEQEWNEAVQWVGANGERLSGAPAVFAALATTSASGRTLLSLYNEKPWFARSADMAYRAVARNRMFFSQVTQLLWGADVRAPTFAISSWLFLRLIGVVYLLAFGSYWIQLSGLNGAKGILPAAEFFDRVREILGDAGFLQFPSLCWLGAGDTAL